MKIGRNEKCPCGSGKKYKLCCLNRESDLDFLDISKFSENYKSIMQSARFKECLYPDHSNCSERIIKAHSIQNNKILKKIASNGKVYMPIPKEGNPLNSLEQFFSNSLELYGRKEATIFTGFCSYHDTTVFSPIENFEFTNTSQQIFLYVYRCVSLEYYKKIVMRNAQKYICQKLPFSLSTFESDILDATKAVSDLNIVKKVVDKALLESNFSVINSVVWEFDGLAKFACSGFEAPSIDFTGNELQDLLNYSKPVHHLFYSIFPENESVFAIIAWLKSNDEFFIPIIDKLKKLTISEKKAFLNNTIALRCENITINPDSWDAWSNSAKEEFNDLLFSDRANNTFNRFKAPNFDLFSL